jgi:hypothetical protein
MPSQLSMKAPRRMKIHTVVFEFIMNRQTYSGEFCFIICIDTECYVKLNDYNPKSHQHLLVNSLVNRLLSRSLEQTEYTKEYKQILKTPKVNGFDI